MKKKDILENNYGLVNIDGYSGYSTFKNIDLKQDGIKKRLGWQKVVDLTDIKNLSAASNLYALFQSSSAGGTFLLSLTDWSYTLISDNIIETSVLTCVQYKEYIYWSNGDQIGKISINNMNNSFFIPKPSYFNITVSVGGGNLAAGDYTCAISYGRLDGTKGPKSTETILSVSDGDGIYFSWSDIAQPNTEYYTYFHISKKDLGSLYQAKRVLFSAGFGYYQNDGSELSYIPNILSNSQKAGSKIIIWNDKMFSILGDTLYYSNYPFEMMESSDNLSFPDAITNIIPMSSKKLVVTTKKGVYILLPNLSYRFILETEVLNGGVSQPVVIVYKNTTYNGCYLLIADNAGIFLTESEKIYKLTPQFKFMREWGNNCQIAALNNECFSIHF